MVAKGTLKSSSSRRYGAGMAEMPSDLQEANRKTIEEFRAAGRKFPGRALLLLTTTGAKTGQPRTNPMMYVEIDGRRLVIASNAGAPKHPDWYRNEPGCFGAPAFDAITSRRPSISTY